VREYAFGYLGLRRLIALIDLENVRSVRVAQKIGLHREKEILFRGKPVTVFSSDKSHSECLSGTYRSIG
jgi:RimJ/RimL family protein N-acetyltransferase